MVCIELIWTIGLFFIINFTIRVRQCKKAIDFTKARWPLHFPLSNPRQILTKPLFASYFLSNFLGE